MGFGSSVKSAVGLDIGSHSVKVVELVRAGKSLKLAHYAIQELAPGTVVDGEIVNREHVNTSIRDALRNADIKPKAVFSAVSGRSVIVRRIPMEKMSEEEARQAIHWEAEQHIPFRIDEVSIDFKIINPELAPGQMEVLLVAAKKEAVELHRGLLAGAGVRPGAIELEQFALQRAYEFSYKPSGDECVTILNIGAEVTNMVVVKGGLPSFNRDLSIGGSRFIEALQRSMGLDYETSEKVLRGELPEGVSADEVKSALSYVIEELSTSVRRSFISFQASGESTRIDRMYVSGGCSLVPGLATTLSEQHGLPVEALQPFQNLVVDSSVIPESDRPAIGALLAVSIGLALRGFEPGRVDINVMEAGEVKKKKAAAGGGAAAPSGSPVAAILGALPIILIAAGIILMGLHYMNLKKQEKTLQGQIVQMDADIAEMQSQVSLQQEAADLASQLAVKQADVQSLALNQRYAVYVMEYLCRALYPEQTALAEEADKGIYLTAMVLSDSTMHITGIARTWGDIVSFQRRLAELKPDGQNTLFQLASYGQTYSLTMITPTGNMPAGVGTGVAAAAETRYQFDLEVSVNRASLAPLVGDYSGI
jgi:type IV pilus assembly protein PilM